MELKIQKVVRVVRKEDAKGYEEWLNVSPEEKLSVLQELRELHIELFPDQVKTKGQNEDRRRLQRVYRIVKRTRC